MDPIKGYSNKANLRDLIAATGLVILLKLDSNRWFFSSCDLEIWWMTLKNNRASLLYATLSFVHHFKTIGGFKQDFWSRNALFGSKLVISCPVWPWKIIGHLFYVTSSFMHHFIVIDEFNLKLRSGNAQFGSKSAIFCHVWPWNLKDDVEKQ